MNELPETTQTNTLVKAMNLMYKVSIYVYIPPKFMAPRLGLPPFSGAAGASLSPAVLCGRRRFRAAGIAVDGCVAL